MDIILIILGAVCLLVGLAGCILPVLPGVPVAYASLWLLHATNKVQFGWRFLLVWGVVTGLGHEGDGRVEGRRVGKHCRTGCRTLSRPLGHRVRTLRGGRRRRDPRQQERERGVARTGPAGGNRLVRRAADGHRAETHLRGTDDLLLRGGGGVKRQRIMLAVSG